MFENLQKRLTQAFRTLTGRGKISEINISETVKEIRRALVEADVNYRLAKEITQRIKEKAIGQDILIAVEPGQLFVKIVYDELVELMGGKRTGIQYASTPPTIILLAGLQGSGKTTFAAKLANFLKTREKKSVLLAACDVYRPAAIEQLSTLGEQINVPVVKDHTSKDPIDIAQKAVQKAKTEGYDVVIIDTAGRLTIDEAMMEEIANLKKTLNPTEILFVVDAMTGQDAVNTARAFNEVLDFTGVVLTKLDGDTRGGAALSIKAEVNKPIKFIGTGEKIQDIDFFYPDRMASRILGMGDVLTLVERAQQQFDKEEAQKLRKKIEKNKFDLNDFLSQLRMIKKMGNLKELVSFIPGASQLVGNLDQIDDSVLKRIEAIILSMTPQERRNPEILNASRKRRIARGSGTSVEDVNELLRQFTQLKKMFKTIKKLEKSKRKPNLKTLFPQMRK